MEYISLTQSNIASEHICCAISDRKCKESYEAKKSWLTEEFSKGYEFIRLDERAKVFIEFGPAENSWLPIAADNYIALGCFWVSGKYKGAGHGKQLLGKAKLTAEKLGKNGLVTVVGKKKKGFMSDTNWLKKQGFSICDEAPNDFVLLYFPLNDEAVPPRFLPHVQSPDIEFDGCVAYYSNRCPFSEYHVLSSLVESCNKRGIPLKIVKLDTLKKAQSCPSPATIFSLYYQGHFVTTDISACMDTRFDKYIKESI
ncbi:YoaP domain-containing protein [Vibrio nigripulchritudo]|uniref:YoaP domain-containing protein n=1 Tax=Vibrio nigripulchritudo TaxID=28173 RepID=UPI002491F32B|nr:YoaP domain-containing protein [Vibrio nigripulchritudo]BDU39713.1 GNAT family acetyltransferase [Vibrio nigripulchritudo]BDU45436.1 GNAT family acetyltransferase [Vibrio nigripulchritudo]